MVKSQKYNLSVIEGFEMFLTSKLIKCFIDNFTLKRKSQSIAYLLNGSKHIHWILDLENEVYSIWVTMDKWPSRMQGLGQGQGAEALAFLVLPLPATLTRAMLVGGI